MTQWVCADCQKLNQKESIQCESCFRFKAESSLFKVIMHAQQLLFDGYIRTEIVNDVSMRVTNLLNIHVIKLCNKFHNIDIKSEKDKAGTEFRKKYQKWIELNQKQAEIHVLVNLCEQLTLCKQFFIAHKLCESLTQIIDIEPSLHHTMTLILTNWNNYKHQGFEQKIISEYERAIELDPKSSIYRHNFGVYLDDIHEYELEAV